MIYWLKTKTDIDASDYAYDALCFPLDLNATDIDLDTPARKYNYKKIIGNGASISGGDSFTDRTMSFKRIFKSDGVGTSGALTQARLDFISKYIVTRDDIYLIRDYNTSLQYIKVVPTMGSEKYKKLVVSNELDIKLMCSVPFFKDITDTVEVLTDKASRFYHAHITNPGVMTPFTFQGTFDDNDTEFKLSLYANLGIKITEAFTTGDILKIDTGTFRVWINNIERFNLTIVGSPFNLLSGANTVSIESIADIVDMALTYTGRNI
jgi:hypothetical protein